MGGPLGVGKAPRKLCPPWTKSVAPPLVGSTKSLGSVRAVGADALPPFGPGGKRPLQLGAWQVGYLLQYSGISALFITFKYKN